MTLDGLLMSRLGQRTATKLRRERFGFVFQSDQLLGELPAVENVALPLMLGGMSRRSATARAAEWFAPLGLAGLETRRPGQMSGGQVQRVSIARALVVGPSVVFADEPTAALDRATSTTTMQPITEPMNGTQASNAVSKPSSKGLDIPSNHKPRARHRVSSTVNCNKPTK